MKGVNSYAKYLGMGLAKTLNGDTPCKTNPFWAKGKPQTFEDRIGEAIFGKIMWTWWKCKEKRG